MGREIESNSNVAFDCKYHVVWCPKYRRKVLVAPVDARLKEIVRGMCAELRVQMVEMEVMPDHVHLLLAAVDPQFGIHRVVKAIKGRSSRLLRQEFAALRTRQLLDTLLHVAVTTPDQLVAWASQGN